MWADETQIPEIANNYDIIECNNLHELFKIGNL